MIRFKPEWKVPAGMIGVGVGSFIMGAVAGYLFSEKRKEKVPVEEEDLQLQFDFHREENDRQYHKKVAELTSLAEEIKGRVEEKLESRSEQVAREMHEYVIPADAPGTDDDDWDYEVELRNRDEAHPYTIHQDEFFANEKDYNQVTLTYYAGDDVLCDELDVPIYNPQTIVGQLRFGHGSNDAMVVFIRNDKMEAEYEIQLEPGKYAVEILGAKAEDDILDDDVKHGNAIHKFHKD
jgi:hypothetical protein